MVDSALLARFETLAIPPEQFRHQDHVRVAFHMLRAHDFIEAGARYAKTIKAMAERAGAPEKFNVTITFAFMSLIAERLARSPDVDLDTFLATNADLLDSRLLTAWYSDSRLASEAARGHFLLPDRAGVD